MSELTGSTDKLFAAMRRAVAATKRFCAVARRAERRKTRGPAAYRGKRKRGKRWEADPAGLFSTREGKDGKAEG